MALLLKVQSNLVLDRQELNIQHHHQDILKQIFLKIAEEEPEYYIHANSPPGL